jgi:hypothetical protein
MSQQDIEKVTCKLCSATFNTVEERDTHNEQQHPEEMKSDSDDAYLILFNSRVGVKFWLWVSRVYTCISGLIVRMRS